LTSIEIHAVIRAAINECQPEATVVIMADAPVYRMDRFERDAVLDEPAAEDVSSMEDYYFHGRLTAADPLVGDPGAREDSRGHYDGAIEDHRGVGLYGGDVNVDGNRCSCC
jgi:hypothetical protein